MNEFDDAFDTLLEGFETVLGEMIEEDTIQHLSVMGVSVGNPSFPFVEIFTEEPFQNLEDTGVSEIWEGDIIFASQVLNNTDPREGIKKATSIISEVKTRITKSRYLKELGMYYIKAKDFGWVPYGFGKQKNIYGAGVTFTIRFKLKNPQCGKE